MVVQPSVVVDCTLFDPAEAFGTLVEAFVNQIEA
jgi:hypothetical protein